MATGRKLQHMAEYVSVRGWLQVDHKQRDAVEAIIAQADDDFYSGGWAFPRTPFNWSLYVFYGGDIRIAGLPWLRAQVNQIATLTPADDDGDMPTGLFVLTHATAQVIAWEIREGTVRDRPAPELAWTFQK